MYYIFFHFLVLFVISLYKKSRKQVSLESFLVADREATWFSGALSIAASWIWAPAIFISTRIGYERGLSGLLWFCVPNMLALIIFAPIALKVRDLLPDGYSYIGFLKDKGKFGKLQLCLQLFLQIIIYSIQLLAGAELISAVSGTNYHSAILCLAILPLVYAQVGGLKLSIFTDAVQYIIIAAVAAAILFFFPGRPDFTAQTQIFNPFDTNLIMTFGLSSTLGLIVAIFADQQQWQRAFAIKRELVIKSFVTGGVLHFFVTICLGLFGCYIFESGFKNMSALELVGVHFIEQNYSPIMLILFVVMAQCALYSTLDSSLCAFSSICLTELKWMKRTTNAGRLYMLALVLFALIIGFIRPTLLTLWLFAGTIRLSSFSATISSVLSKNFNPKIGIISIASGLIFGGPVFTYGVIWQNDYIRTIGMVLSILSSTLVLVLPYLVRDAKCPNLRQVFNFRSKIS